MTTTKYENKYGSITVKEMDMEEGMEFAFKLLELKENDSSASSIKGLIDIFKGMEKYVIAVDMEFNGHKLSTWSDVMGHFKLLPIAQKLIDQLTGDGEDKEVKK